MSLEIKGDKEIKQALAKLLRIGDKNLWKEVGDKAVDIVVDRTKKGKDVSGTAFKPYSKRYKKTPKKPVNLKRTGDMLNAVTAEAHDDHARIYVRESGRSDGESNFALAMLHNEGDGKIPRREFFGIEQEREVNKLYEIAKKYVEKLIRMLNR